MTRPVQYAFGDAGIAAQRLRVLADTFEQSSRAFLLEAKTGKPTVALDLGCGPGYSTRLLAEVFECERVVGLDSSEHFLALAQEPAKAPLSFCLHDITRLPLPGAPADVLYCRFVLTHLREPQTILKNWVSQLKSKGLILVEEVEWIHTQNRLFTEYLKIVEDLLDHQGGVLYVGSRLTHIEGPSFERLMTRVKQVKMSDSRAAMMFFLNIQSWKQHPYVRENYQASAVERLQQELEIVASRQSLKSEITWGLRHFVFRRRPEQAQTLEPHRTAV